MVRSMKCWVDLCLYCHRSGLEVVSESEVVVQMLQYHCLLVIWKGNYWFQIWFSSSSYGINFLPLLELYIMPNKSSLLGVDCNDLLMFSIISYPLLGFSGACLTSSFRFFALQCLCDGVSNDWLVETLENKLFLDNPWNCLQPQSCHHRSG